METIIIHAESKKAKAIKQFLDAFGVAFKVDKKESPYNKSFVNKVLERTKSAEEGNFVSYDSKLKKVLFENEI